MLYTPQHEEGNLETVSAKYWIYDNLQKVLITTCLQSQNQCLKKLTQKSFCPRTENSRALSNGTDVPILNN